MSIAKDPAKKLLPVEPFAGVSSRIQTRFRSNSSPTLPVTRPCTTHGRHTLRFVFFHDSKKNPGLFFNGPDRSRVSSQRYQGSGEERRGLHHTMHVVAAAIMLQFATAKRPPSYFICARRHATNHVHLRTTMSSSRSYFYVLVSEQLLGYL